MAKQIYYVRSCGIYPHDRSDVIWIGTSQKKCKMFVSKEIEEGNMDYYNEELSRKEQARQFRLDWDNSLRRFVNDRLTYGYIDYCYDNSEV